jgi:arylsulfatase A-like enzyme/phosphodiesterase/alkaline phosphatase D-like protein
MKGYCGLDVPHPGATNLASLALDRKCLQPPFRADIMARAPACSHFPTTSLQEHEWAMNHRHRLSPQSAFVAVVLIVFARNGVEAAEKPNFVIVNVDDLGYGDIGPFGSELNRTPNIDRMAQEGRKLTCFYAAPVCSPSRAALMTGCYPKRALPIPHVLFPGNDVGLAPEEVTVAELLKEQGYATACIGKWHLGDQPEFLPTQQGFDYYFGLPYSNDMGPAEDGVKSNLGAPLPQAKGKGQPPLPLMRNETVLQRVLPADQTQLVERYTEEAVKFLWANREGPFFLYLPHSAVHFPLYPGNAFQGTSQNGLYGDWVEEVDWSVGQILDTLRQLDLAEKTLVIFTSDNGGPPRHGAVNGPLRGGKGSTWEGGMRVPTIVWQPGKIPAGTATDEIAGMIDILPTLVKLAGGEPPQDRTIDGGDIWPILADAPDAASPHEVFYYYRGLTLEAVRSGPWKLHLAKGELYNLEEDRGETANVAAENVNVVEQLRSDAEETKDDLGAEGVGPGVRPLGKAADPQPLINHDGQVRAGFEAPEVLAGMGIMVGEVTPTTALVQVRLTKSDRLVEGDVPGAKGVVEFTIQAADSKDAAAPQSQVVDATAERDFIARAAFADLKPGMQYVCRTRIGTDRNDLRSGPEARFKTLFGGEIAAPVSFVVVTGMNYAKFHGDARIDRKQHLLQNNTELAPPYSKPDKQLGYPALETLRKLNPNFFVGTGDNVYYDTPTNPRAQAIPELRRKWHEQFVQPRYRDFFAVVPTYWEIDDHDYRLDDCDNTGDYDPSPEVGRTMMLQQLPVAPADAEDPKTYRTHRVSGDLQIWLTENRMYRSPNKVPDGPEKTIWGAEQKAWLKRTLSESDATFKILISPTPMIGPDDLRKTDNHCDIGGFQHERDEFFSWLTESGLAEKNFYLVCGDRHWQYHSVFRGIDEFSCGALVDENSRLGRKPGDPQSTDPNAEIKQPYYQQPASGGFLLVHVTPASNKTQAKLTFDFRDEQGKVLYRHEPRPAPESN